MPRLTLAALAALLIVGCAPGTYDRAAGTPDATRWTYLDASAERVVAASEAYAERAGGRLESAEPQAGADGAPGGVLLTLAPRDGGAGVLLVYVERSPVERYGSRAQVWPRRGPLPRDLAAYLSTFD